MFQKIPEQTGFIEKTLPARFLTLEWSAGWPYAVLGIRETFKHGENFRSGVPRSFVVHYSSPPVVPVARDELLEEPAILQRKL